MEFGFTEAQEKLRKEVHDFFISELPEDYKGMFLGITPANGEFAAFMRQLQRKAGARGWLTPGWPKEYGGLGLSELDHMVVKEDVGRWVGASWPNYVGIDIAGPTMLLFCTEEQKRKFLPPIARGEVQWDQLFTEPNAGSDEANVQLRATFDGNAYVFNGQKMFVGEIYKPDYFYTLARTADTRPRHRGLTLFIVPANLPGITYGLLPVMSGQTKKEVFFDNVRVPRENIIGEVNRGFYHAMASLQFERAHLGNPASDRRDAEEFVQYCQETERNGKPLMADPRVRDAVAKMVVELEVNRLASWWTAWKLSKREELGNLDYDLSGFFRRTFTTSRCRTMMEILGLYGQLGYGSKWAPMAGIIERKWQRARSLHAGGTTEILKVVLAERGLGLPRRQ
ncbi:MAG: acyl-CoA dehydrogenase family protein [Chloroflexi bacterium]|nr:acyl-CoA dehydrogenase family protein [Chloroflexota bacterium]